MNNATMNTLADDLMDMFADLEAALYREVQVHGESVDMELVAAVAEWAVKLRDNEIIGKWAFKSAQNLLAQAGWEI